MTTSLSRSRRASQRTPTSSIQASTNASGPSVGVQCVSGPTRSAATSDARSSTPRCFHLEAEDPEKDVQLYVNSPGGDMTALFAIYDTMQHVAPDVATTCVGQAASAAAVIPAGGVHAAGKRTTLPNSRILIHQPHGGAQGQSVDIEIQVREMVIMRERMIDVLSHHTRGRAVMASKRARCST